MQVLLRNTAADIMAIDGGSVGYDGDVGGKGDVGGSVLVGKGDTALVDVGGAGNIGGKGDRGGAVPMCSKGSIVMPLICTTHSAQLLRQ